MSNPERGRRFALARRLLGAFEGIDLPAPAMALRLGKDKKQVYRYERGDDRPPEAVVAKLAELCSNVGLPFTEHWLERGGILPPIIVPASALAAPPVPEEEPTEEPVFEAARTKREKPQRKTKQPAKKQAGGKR